MTNRVHIDAPAGIVEIEGEKDFVEGLLAKVFPLLEEVSFGSKAVADRSTFANGATDGSQDVVAASDEDLRPKIKRRRGSAPPKGQSCAARVLSLKDGGFFKDHQSVSDIVSGLKTRGWTHTSNQVGAALTDLFGRGEIQRTKEGKGAWKYYWDRV